MLIKIIAPLLLTVTTGCIPWFLRSATKEETVYAEAQAKAQKREQKASAPEKAPKPTAKPGDEAPKTHFPVKRK